MVQNKIKSSYFFLSILFLLLLGFTTGWIARGQRDTVQDSNSLYALRLSSGFEFINPLLSCDTETDEESVKSTAIERIIKKVIQDHINKGDITHASVYYRDLITGISANVGEKERFYPASLGKIPIMMAIFKIARNDPEFLEKELLWDDTKDYNAEQVIKPKEFLVYGKKYKIIEAIEMMIKYSDNNSFYFLEKNLNQETFNSTYSDLHVPIRDDPASSPDYISAKQFSYFFRVLYSATYLNRQYSELALSLLSKSDYSRGIVAGLPENTTISHKYGYSKMVEEKIRHEFHDCGIIYKDNNSPFLLCVMTKGESGLEEMEKTVQNISSKVYNSL